MTARIHWLSSVARVAIVGAAALAAAASSGSNQQPPATAVGGGGGFAAPAPRHMEPGTELGLWRSSFGPVKIEVDPRGGQDQVQGAWRYMRGAQEVIGIFWGSMRGNVLEFEWQEPGQGTPLAGKGFLVFDPGGDRFQGKWWTSSQDRSGDWNGWRDDPAASGGPAEQAPPEGDGYDRSGAPPAPPPTY